MTNRPSYQGHGPRLATAFCWVQRHPVPDSAGALQIGRACWAISIGLASPTSGHLQGGTVFLQRSKASAPLYPRVSPNLNLTGWSCDGSFVKGALASFGLDQSSDCVPYLCRNSCYVAKTVIASALWCHFLPSCGRLF